MCDLIYFSVDEPTGYELRVYGPTACEPTIYGSTTPAMVFFVIVIYTLINLITLEPSSPYLPR